jgi:adenine-specific DNA-methyltransferase
MFGLTTGFDVVIGNPPYLNVELESAEQKAYFADHYKTFYKRFDVFGLFFECSLCELVRKGIVAFIIPAQVFNNLSYKKLRDLMLSKRWLREVLHLGDKIFTAANNDVCVLFLNTAGVTSIRLVDALDFQHPTVTDVPPTQFEQFGGVISVSSSIGADGIASKVFHPNAERVHQHFEVFQGIVTGNNPIYLPEPDQIAAAKIEKNLLHLVLHGRDFDKWRIHNTSRRILYVDGDTDLKHFPNAEAWLTPHRIALKTQRECVNGVIPWYSLQWPRKKELLDVVPKVVVQATRNPRLKVRIVAALDEEGYYGTQGVNFIVPITDALSAKALLALLNSSLVN